MDDSELSSAEEVELTYDNERVPVEYERTKKNVRTPCRGTPFAAGYDAFSQEHIVLKPGERHYFDIELKTRPPKGWCFKVYNRSGLACKHDVHIPGAPLVVDSDYRGHIIICLKNYHKEQSYEVEKGERIAQLLIERCYKIRWIPARIDEDNTVRGAGGFGSTGR